MAAPAGAPVLFLYSLAEHLNKSVEQIRQISDEELEGWRAYFSIKNQS